MRFIVKILLILFISINLASSAFIRNNGQWEDNIKFLAKLEGCNVWFTDNEIRFDNYKFENADNKLVKNGFVYNLTFENEHTFKYSAKSSGAEIYNYIRSSNTSTSEYDTLIIEEISSGIDVYFYVEANHLRYDFYIDNNGNADKIAVKTDVFHEIKNNSIYIPTRFGDIIHGDIKAYSAISDDDIPVEISSQNNTARFNLSNNIQNDLIIDPLIFSTYFGGSSYDFVRDMVIDSAGYIYITGFTSSENFPVDTGAYSRELNNNQWDYPDVFVSKFSPDGKNLVFSTYIGGLGDDYAESIAIDTSGYIYITGYTWSIEFPLTEDIYQDSAAGGYDAFVLKLDSNGSNLIYSTLIGGSKDDYGTSIAVNNAGEAHIVGYCTSDGNYPITDNAFQKLSRGKYDTFITKISSDATELEYSTYWSGSDDDFGQDILLYPDGRVLVAGRTSSSNLTTSPDAYDRDFSSSDTSDAFFGIISESGNSLIYGTYFGGSKEDGAYSAAFDNFYNIHISGYTESVNFPVTENVHDKILNNDINLPGSSDSFIAKFDSTGRNLLYSTYFGGSSAERAYCMTIDNNNYAYIAGTTTSDDMPVSVKAIDTTIGSLEKTSDAFMAKFTPEGNELSYSTYFGGSFNEVARGIAVNPEDQSIILTGMTNSDDLPVYGTTVDSTYNDTLKADIFITRFLPSFINFDLGEDISICRGDSILISTIISGGLGELTYEWTPDLYLSSNDSSHTCAFPDSTTVYQLSVSDSAGNTESDNITIYISDVPEFEIAGAASVNDSTETIYRIINKHNSDSLSWGIINGEIIEEFEDSVQVSWYDTSSGIIFADAYNANGCSYTDSLRVIIGEKFRFEISLSSANDTLCEGDFAIISPDKDYSEYYYSDGTSTKYDTVRKSGEYFLIVKDENGMFGISDTINIEFIQKPSTFINGEKFCREDSTYKYVVPNESDVVYNISINGGMLIDSTENEYHVRWGPGTSGKIRLIAENISGCRDTASLNIFIGNFTEPDIEGFDDKGNKIDGDLTFCNGKWIVLDAGKGYSEYLWQDSSDTRYLQVSESGLYWVVTKDIIGNNHYSDTLEIKVLQNPPQPQITILGSRIRCNTIATAYQWYRNGLIMQGITERIIEPEENGYYEVEITATNGCKNISDRIYFDNTDVHEFSDPFSFEIFPNPARNLISVNCSQSGNYGINIYNALGVLVLNTEFIGSSHEIVTDGLPGGIYFMVISNGSNVFRMSVSIVK